MNDFCSNALIFNYHWSVLLIEKANFTRNIIINMYNALIRHRKLDAVITDAPFLATFTQRKLSAILKGLFFTAAQRSIIC